MTYNEARDREQLAVHKRALGDFVDAYKQGLQSTRAAKRRTLFFFPGGMASKLKRSKERFAEGANTGFHYDQVWGGCEILTGGAFHLGMYKGADGFRDLDDRIIVADGALQFGHSTPHDGLISWCGKNNVDLFVFNWDWRRRLEETAQFFVEQFWCAFEERMRREQIPEAAQNYSLLGHSFGGMVVNLILRTGGRVADGVQRAITAATPFYGYPGQVHRWFEGEPILNGPDPEHQEEMVRIICSLPALYVLHSPDLDVTFPRDQQTLSNDQNQQPAFPLTEYPTLDKDTGQRVDPWKQDTASDGRVRYPTSAGFMLDELDHAKRVSRLMASPLNDERFFNIRGVTKTLLGNQPREHTYGTVRVGWIKPDFNSGQTTPITDTAKFPGDGVQPAWTARLASNAPQRCRTVIAKNITHMLFMNHRDTMQELGSILFGAHETFVPLDDVFPSAMASDREVDEFVSWVRGYVEGYRAAKSGEAPSEDEIGDAMRRKYGDKLALIWRRIIEVVLKVPPAARE